MASVTVAQQLPTLILLPHQTLNPKRPFLLFLPCFLPLPGLQKAILQMKKPSNGVAARGVHPAPQLDRLAALPSAVLALAVALSAEEQEVLDYLLSAGGEWPQQREHSPELRCRCFGCYKSFWARWDASPNRKLIHRIIDAVEEGIEWQEKERGRRRRRRRPKGANLEATATAEEDKSAPEATHFPNDGDGDGSECDDHASNSINGSKSSASGLVSFIGERFWRVWK